jgi:acyl-CoA synthetase (AMP-forming)/AMP-acid ligase II
MGAEDRPAAELPLTIPALLRGWADEAGDAEFLVTEEERLGVGQAEARSAELARGLLAAGIGHSTHVGLLFPSGVAFALAWLAAARIGAVAVPISTFSTPDELGWLLLHANVGVLLAAREYRSNDYAAALRSALPELDLAGPPPFFASRAPWLRRVFVSGSAVDVHPANRERALLDAGAAIRPDFLAAAEERVRPADRMVIIHTSGSTRTPKAVVHTHGGLIRHLRVLNRIRGLHAGDRLFSNSPFFWIGGLGYNLVGSLAARSTLIVSTSGERQSTLDLIERERPRLVNGFAQTVARVVEDPTYAARDFSSVESGNLYAVMPEKLRPADPELRHNMLGMTETGSVCLTWPDESDLPESLRGSFGKPVPGLEARVVDPETLADCETGAVGELWFRGPALMEGYYGRERHEVFTPDGWYRSGDLCSVDAQGFHYFKGRLGDMIKTGGANVSPREVEAALREVTGCSLAIAFGLDDAQRGQIVAAVAVMPAGAAFESEAVRTALRAKLSAFKVPRRLVRLSQEELPLLSSGKPDLRRLAEIVRASV